MSKSKGNYIGINEAPDEMFGKLMSISDELMWRYYELLSFRPMSEIAALKRACEAGANPRDAKVALAQEIVERFHSKAACRACARDFRGAQGRRDARRDAGGHDRDRRRRHRDRQSREAGGRRRLDVRGAAPDRGRGLKLDGEVVADKGTTVAAGSTVVVQAGKRRFARVAVR
jgi:tyrosyl-tRNA synthetase